MPASIAASVIGIALHEVDALFRREARDRLAIARAP